MSLRTWSLDAATLEPARVIPQERSDPPEVAITIRKRWDSYKRTNLDKLSQWMQLLSCNRNPDAPNFVVAIISKGKKRREKQKPGPSEAII